MELLLPILIVAVIIYVTLSTWMIVAKRHQPNLKGWTGESLFSPRSILVAALYCLAISAVIVVVYAAMAPSWMALVVALLAGVVTMAIVGKIVARSTHAACPLPPPKA